MDRCIKIVITINSPEISHFHETLASIKNQRNIQGFNISIDVINKAQLDIQSELHKLKKSDLIKDIESPRFVLKLNSGETISRSYLYKAIHYLEQNSVSFTAPEYTLTRIENRNLITYMDNKNQLAEIANGVLFDTQKELDGKQTTPRVIGIRDTVISTIATYDAPNIYLKNIKKLANKTVSQKHYITPKNILHTCTDTPVPTPINPKKSLKAKLVNTAKKYSGKAVILKSFFAGLEKIREDKSSFEPLVSTPYISPTLRNEMHDLSEIDFSLKGIDNMHFMNITNIQSEVFEEHCATVKGLVETLSFDNYDYFMILPWIISGGIDLFAKNYLNYIAKELSDKNILVILTNDHHLSYTKEQLQLPNNVDILDMPRFFSSNPKKINNSPKYIASLVNIYSPNRVHIMASKSGYDSLIEYADCIRENSKIIFSSYNYITNKNGEYSGYTVQELPLAYRPGDIITTDNNESKKLWVEHYGFNEENILVHKQLLTTEYVRKNQKTINNNPKILWAAHIRPEKNPTIVPKIAKKLLKNGIKIDCYGLFDQYHWKDGVNPLAAGANNLTYRGKYTSFFNDINLDNYSIFLYTSFTDGTPNVVIEAGLARLPIISTKIGGIPDLIKDNGVLISDPNSVEEFTEAILNTLNNYKDAQEKANILAERLKREHGENNFKNQIKDMLERSKK